MDCQTAPAYFLKEILSKEDPPRPAKCRTSPPRQEGLSAAGRGVESRFS